MGESIVQIKKPEGTSISIGFDYELKEVYMIFDNLPSEMEFKGKKITKSSMWCGVHKFGLMLMLECLQDCEFVPTETDMIFDSNRNQCRLALSFLGQERFENEDLKKIVNKMVNKLEKSQENISELVEQVPLVAIGE